MAESSLMVDCPCGAAIEIIMRLQLTILRYIAYKPVSSFYAVVYNIVIPSNNFNILGLLQCGLQAMLQMITIQS